MDYLTCAIIPLIFEMGLCYMCFMDTVWLTKYWAVTLAVHATLCTMTVIFWIYYEYKTVHQVMNQNRIVPVWEDADHAAVLQMATRRKLASRETRGISKPTKSAGHRRKSIVVKYEDSD